MHLNETTRSALARNLLLLTGTANVTEALRLIAEGVVWITMAAQMDAAFAAGHAAALACQTAYNMGVLEGERRERARAAAGGGSHTGSGQPDGPSPAPQAAEGGGCRCPKLHFPAVLKKAADLKKDAKQDRYSALRCAPRAAHAWVCAPCKSCRS